MLKVTKKQSDHLRRVEMGLYGISLNSQKKGCPKLKINFKTCTLEQLSEYCKRDVEILLKTWQKYFAWFIENDLGNFGVTISSQSFNTFRHRFTR